MIRAETNESHSAMVTEEMISMWESKCLSNKTLLWLMQKTKHCISNVERMWLKHWKIISAIRVSIEEKQKWYEGKWKGNFQNKKTEKKGEIKIRSRHSQNTICLACMKQCHSSSNQGIWMPHIAAKHRSEQKDTHGVLQTAGLSRAVHTKAAPALPPCTAHHLA